MEPGPKRRKIQAAAAPAEEEVEEQEEEYIFPFQPQTSQKATLSVYTELLQNDRLNLQPSYQRCLVWDVSQMGKLVDTMVQKMYLPPVVLYRNSMDVPECIDGQNRLTAIKMYIEQCPDDDPWPWVRELKSGTMEFIYYLNPKTKDEMLEYCRQQNKPTRAGAKRKVHRLMTPQEVERFDSYQIVISEVLTKIPSEVRKDMFLRLQGGTPISQCDYFKNQDYPFCNFLRDEELEHQFAPRISPLLKSKRRNWFWDIYRLLNVFLQDKEHIEPVAVLLCTFKARLIIEHQKTESFNKEEMKNAVRRCDRFLSRVSFLEKIQKIMYISVLLEVAYLYITLPVHVVEILCHEEFLLKFLSELLADKTFKRNTLNNVPNHNEIIPQFSEFHMRFMVAYDEQKTSEAGAGAGAGAGAAATATATDKKQQRTIKEAIPGARKTEVWNHYIGVTLGQAKCMCCNIRDITARDFVAGHVISESDGGTIDITNLRPICATCNSSMSSKNMFAYMKKMYPGNKLPLATGRVGTGEH